MSWYAHNVIVSVTTNADGGERQNRSEQRFEELKRTLEELCDSFDDDDLRVICCD